MYPTMQETVCEDLRPHTHQSTKCIDEGNPLIPKVLTSLSQQCPMRDKALDEASDENISPRKLKWIMASVWIGTFCAGLGENR